MRVQAKSRRRTPAEFVLFCEARTGSYNLVSRLDSCPDIICHGEIFKKNRLELPKYHRAKVTINQKDQRDMHAEEFIKQLRSINPFKIFGFKFFWHHVQWAPSVVRYLSDPEIKRVVLHRDPLAMFASACRAAETGEWTLRQTASVQHSSKETQITFRKEKFEVFAAHYNRFTAACYMLAQIPNTFVIEYNQINNAKVLDKLLTFLGSRASGEDTMTSFRKQYSGTVREAFVNWDDVQEKLRTMALLEGPPPTISS